MKQMQGKRKRGNKKKERGEQEEKRGERDRGKNAHKVFRSWVQGDLGRVGLHRELEEEEEEEPGGM